LGIFLAAKERAHDPAGDHVGDGVDSVPGEYCNTLKRLIVTQADTEPASVEQQRFSRTRPVAVRRAKPSR
jgi:benzoyl-CoA 2,3-dioxygenase component B